MQPYRLEMGTRLDTDTGNNLYQFWDGSLTDSLNAEFEHSGSKILVNLASGEYFKAIKPKQLQAEIVTPQFKEYHKGDYRFVQFYAKKARGLMARYIIDNRIDAAEGLKDFDVDGYRFAPKLSNGSDWVFTRRQ